ncbi:T9SS type B sorting domain-containing protein [Taibaiella lutea]|uniref:T9SS type B sorting domain-containing protein n=1 Tax=Taibaiella lutea TaxID=2608001 RepID=A0A5M6CDV9_9BACT|nr:gliding motility-associated C-terminal domain-containing protein [Taibaiella lutea]KAA5533354.1 T9SS type B sorting domain-containing protein [Taibaiella lutea]
MKNKNNTPILSKWHVLLTCCFAVVSLLFSNKANAQAAGPCDSISPFCTDDTTTYTNQTGVPTPPFNFNLGCLGSAPNQAWFYMQIATTGPMQFNISQNNTAGTPIDVDFAMWGPFTSMTQGCSQVSSNAAPIQCSYSAAAVEQAGLGMPGGTGSGASTPPIPNAGEIYLIVITNFSNQPGTVTFNQSGGTGETDCSIICGLHASNNGPVCQGTPATLTATNDDTTHTFDYLWTGPGGFTSTLQNPSVIINSPGVFTFTVRSISNENDTCNEQTTIEILATNLMPTDISICSGETYNWFGKEYYNAGTYDTTFTNMAGCDSVVRLNLTVNPLPNVATKGAMALGICAGSSTKLSLITSEPNVTYQWMRDGYPVSGQTNYFIEASEAGRYKVVATTNKGCTKTSAEFNLTVNPNPVAKVQPLSNEIICAYDTMEVMADQGTNYEYRWSPEKPFRAITGAEGQKVKGVFIDPVTQVVLTVFNEFGCYDSDTALVQTKPCCEVLIPNAFSPNNDNKNDYFNPMLQNGQILLSFKVYDRFGKLVYDNESPKLGWNGNYKDGTPAASAVYMYYVKYTCADGKLYEKKESITLLR